MLLTSWSLTAEVYPTSRAGVETGNLCYLQSNERAKYLYDVAISFLSGDEPLALNLHEQLSETFSVFMYPKKQEELAGTDGLESFRQAFFSQSRLVVILYRNGWGKTRWTAVEELAIKERMFEGGWRSLLFVMLDQQSTYPAWLPETHVRLDYTKFADSLLGRLDSGR